MEYKTFKIASLNLLISSILFCISGCGGSSNSGEKLDASPDVQPGQILQTFSLENTNGDLGSQGFARVGLPFQKGHVPEGYVPQLSIENGEEIAAVQFDERVTWSDGSLKFAVCHFRDTEFSAAEVRRYTLVAVKGSYQNNGTYSLDDIAADSDLRIELTNLTQANTSPTNMNNHTASLNEAMRVASRVTKIHSGPVTDGWVVWQMVSDDVSNVDDVHLQANWYINVWNDGSGSVAKNIEFGAKLGQVWWKAPGKDRRDYDAALKNGSDVVETYNGIVHHYHGEWFMGRMDDDSQHGKRHWADATKLPTLLYQPDKDYWLSTKLIPPWDSNLSPPAGEYIETYTPMVSLDHRANIDGTGGYMGRGMLPNSDATCFMLQTSDATRQARVQAYAGMHIGYHYRTNALRDRSLRNTDDYNDFSEESDEIANTHIALHMAPLKPAEYDFTAAGLSVAQHAYKGNGSSTESKGGWVGPSGGSGEWSLSSGTSHGVPYSAFMYLLEGERYFYDASAGLAMNTLHQSNGNQYRGRPRLIYHNDAERAASWGIDTNIQYDAVYHGVGSNARQQGLAAVIEAYGWGLCPDNDVHKSYFAGLLDHANNKLAEDVAVFPQEVKDVGLFWWSGLVVSPWMQAIIAEGMFSHFNITESTSYRDVARQNVQYTINLFEMNPLYTFDYRSVSKAALGSPELLTADNLFVGIEACSVSASTDLVTKSAPYGLQWSTGDTILFLEKNDSANDVAIPAGATAGIEYYVLNPNGNTFQVATSPGGTPVDFLSDGNHWMAHQSTATVDILGENGSIIPSSDSYIPIHYQALIFAHNDGHPNATQELVDKAKLFQSTIEKNGSGVTWSAAEIE